MSAMKVAKLFTTGGSQAVRLPVEFRFAGDEVYVRRDDRTGDVILSSRPGADWGAFVALRGELGPLPDDFLADRRQPEEQRDPFEGWQEPDAPLAARRRASTRSAVALERKKPPAGEGR